MNIAAWVRQHQRNDCENGHQKEGLDVLAVSNDAFDVTRPNQHVSAVSKMDSNAHGPIPLQRRPRQGKRRVKPMQTVLRRSQITSFHHLKPTELYSLPKILGHVRRQVRLPHQLNQCTLRLPRHSTSRRTTSISHTFCEMSHL